MKSDAELAKLSINEQALYIQGVLDGIQAMLERYL